MVGGGLGLSLRDRVEFTFVGYTPTRTVRSSSGTDTGDPTSGVRGKIRFANLGGRISIGAHLAYMGSTRERSDVQNEQLTAWDLALPVEFYPAGDGFVDYRWGLYAGPRLVSQSFHDRLTGVTTEGTLAAALLGVVGRWRYFAATGELNVAHATPMTPGGTNGPSDWILLPMGSVRLTIPIGN